jgi:hypothetical protein
MPVVGAPAEVRHGRADGERRVGHAAAHDDLRARIECGGNRLGADVGVGAHDAQTLDLCAQHFLEQRTVFFAREVITLHHRDARRLGAELARHAGDVPRRSARIGCAEVAHDADAVRKATREHGPQHRVEQWLVAGLGVVAAAQLRERQRAFSQRLEDQEGALPGRSIGEPRDQRIDHRPGRIGAVAGKASRAADQQRGQ